MKMLCPECLTECYGDGLYMVLTNSVGGPLHLSDYGPDQARCKQTCLPLCRRCAVRLRSDGFAIYRREKKVLPLAKEPT